MPNASSNSCNDFEAMSVTAKKFFNFGSRIRSLCDVVIQLTPFSTDERKKGPFKDYHGVMVTKFDPSTSYLCAKLYLCFVFIMVEKWQLLKTIFYIDPSWFSLILSYNW